MAAALAFIWKYKEWVALSIVVIFSLVVIAYLKIDHDLMAAKLSRSEAALEIAVRSNEILTQNAASIKEQDKRMKEITVAADKLKLLVRDIPIDVRKALNHESITRINDCLAVYGNTGLLPEGCDAIKASLPVTGAAK